MFRVPNVCSFHALQIYSLVKFVYSLYFLCLFKHSHLSPRHFIIIMLLLFVCGLLVSLNFMNTLKVIRSQPTWSRLCGLP